MDNNNEDNRSLKPRFFCNHGTAALFAILKIRPSTYNFVDSSGSVENVAIENFAKVNWLFYSVFGAKFSKRILAFAKFSIGFWKKALKSTV